MRAVLVILVAALACSCGEDHPECREACDRLDACGIECGHSWIEECEETLDSDDYDLPDFEWITSCVRTAECPTMKVDCLGCERDAECGEGMICVSGGTEDARCTSPCLAHEDCPEGRFCNGSYCD